MLDFAINQQFITLLYPPFRLFVVQYNSIILYPIKTITMNWQSAIGIISTIALFAPVFIIVATRLIRYKQFFPLFIYCLLAFGFNLMTEHLVNVPKTIERYYGIINNLTDMPLILSFLIFQVASSVQAKRMKIIMAVFILFEIVLMR